MIDSGLIVAVIIVIIIISSILACVPFAIKDMIYQIRKKRKKRRLDN